MIWVAFIAGTLIGAKLGICLAGLCAEVEVDGG